MYVVLQEYMRCLFYIYPTVVYYKRKVYLCNVFFEMMLFEADKGRLHVAKPLPFSKMTFITICITVE